MNNAAFETFDDGLVSMRTGETVPDDEPVFILRGRDRKALGTIRVYQSIFAPTSDNWKMTQKVLDDFTDFKKENPEKMMEPKDLY